MLIHFRKKKSSRIGKYKYKKYLFFFITFIGYTFSLSFLLLQKDTLYEKTKKLLPESTRQIIKDSLPYQFYKSNNKLNIPQNYLKGFIQKVDPIYLDIKQRDFDKLLLKRNKAIANGVLISEEDDFVRATISDSKSSQKVRIRLKGDWTDHLQSNKWSYRVKIRGDETFLGMSKFSLQSPGTRNYIWEWFYHKLLENEGLPTLRYLFRPLIVNGNNLGVYAIEEHFDKILIESNNFKEGPILKLSEDLYWMQKKFDKTKLGKLDDESFINSYSTGFKLNKIRKSEEQTNNFVIANQLLNGIHSEVLSTSNVFDIDLLAKFFAINDLVGSYHARAWHNHRFYFDPIQSKLIPIGFDADANKVPLENLSIADKTPWIRTLFKDLEFVKKYTSSLELISKKEYLDSFLSKNKNEFNKNRNILYKSFPALETNTKQIYKNQNLIKKYLNPPLPLNSFLQNIGQSELILSIGNNQVLPIVVKGVRINNKKILIKPKILGSKFDGDFIKYESIVFPLTSTQFPNKMEINKIKLIYSVYGSKLTKKADVNLYPRINPLNIKESIPFKDSDIFNIPFLSIDSDKKLIKFKEKKIFIRKPLIIPTNYKLVVEDGSKIILQDNGFIVSKSPLLFAGSEAKPISVINTSQKNTNGIIILNAKENSSFNNVIFDNLTNIDYKSWLLPGALTIYQSPITLTSCVFENSKSEDALNIVRSNFEINNIKFIKSRSDAIDIDFSDGNLSNIFIENSGNDGLDLSGSKVKIKKLVILNSGDKALSIGEKSNISINKVFIKNAYVGVANKDGSDATISNLSIINSELGITGFKKKKEYAPSKTIIINSDESLNEIPYLLGEGSNLSINNIKMENNSKDNLIIKMLYKN